MSFALFSSLYNLFTLSSFRLQFITISFYSSPLPNAYSSNLSLSHSSTLSSSLPSSFLYIYLTSHSPSYLFSFLYFTSYYLSLYITSRSLLPLSPPLLFFFSLYFSPHSLPPLSSHLSRLSSHLIFSRLHYSSPRHSLSLSLSHNNKLADSLSRLAIID